MSKIKDLKISVKLGLLVAIFLIGFLVFGLFTAYGLNQIQVNGPIYTNIVHGKDLIADILPPPEYIIETHLTSLQMLLSLENGTQKTDMPGLIQKENQLHNDFSARHEYWSQVLAAGNLRTEILEHAYQPAEQYYKTLETQYIPTLQGGDLNGAKKILNETLTPLYLAHRQSIDQVNALASQENSSLEAATVNEVQQLWWLLAAVSLIAASGSVIFGIWITRGIVGPVDQMVTSARRIAAGDVAQQVELRSNDEIGQLAEAFRSMIQYLEKMAGTARKISDNNLAEEVVPSSDCDALGVAFQEMTQNFRLVVGQVQSGVQTLANASTALSGKASSVGQAAEEMSMNSISAAAGMEQAATSLRSIASATEEMTATIGEIAGNAEKARQVTNNAAQQADDISSAIFGLGQSTRDIGNIIETITTISNQTNLLALNATIEAARAGVNGRGFAVVASEIKDLAIQTSSATGDIKQKIAFVQDSTGVVIKDIKGVMDIFAQVSEIVSLIATAIEEQSVVTRDIAMNISQATRGVIESNERVGQTAIIVQNVAQDISGNRSGKDKGHGEKNMITSVDELSHLAEQLRGLVAQFHI